MDGARAVRALVTALLLLVAAVGEARAQQAQVVALDWAFRFASAIESDPKDRAKAQEGVVLDYAAVGALDVAVARAAEIEGWRRGVAYADLATALAQADRADEARELLARAEHERSRVEGWENPRIAAHVARALAALGEAERATSIASDLATQDERQYAGRAAATAAAALAARGEFERAMEQVRALDAQDDFDVAWWRTAGYAAIGRETRLAEGERLEALDAARQSAGGVPGWKGAEALESVAEEFRLLGKRKRARAALEAAEAIVVPLESQDKAPLLSNLARAWAGVGDTNRARGLVALARERVPDAMNIDQPGIWANIATTEREMGDADAARRDFEHAFVTAERLRNARPRALAVSAICRSMGRHGAPIDEPTQRRLDALLAGLGDPW